MKTLSKKLVAGTIAASFVLGAGFIGTLHNQAFADTVSSSSSQKAGAPGKERGGFEGRGGRQGGMAHGGGDIVKQAATALGVEESSVQASLKEGKTLLEIATAAGLTEDEFAAKLVAAQTASIDEQVTAGKLTQEQADKIKADLSTRVKQQIENKGFGDNAGGGFPGRPDGDKGGRGGFPGGFGGGNLSKEAAAVLGVEESSIQASLKEGTTLLQIAQAAGLTEEDFLAKLVEAKKTAIAADVTAGKVTQEQADKMTSDLSERLKQQIENTRPEGRPEGGKGFGPGLMGNSEALTSILGMTQDELRTERESGKSIAEIAAAKGISEDDLVSKLKDSLTDTLKKFVEDKHQKPQAPNKPAPATDSAAAN